MSYRNRKDWALTTCPSCNTFFATKSPDKTTSITKEEVASIVAAHYDIDPAFLLNPTHRRREISDIRHQLAALLFLGNILGATEIGKFLNRNHGTINHSMNEHVTQMQYNEEYRKSFYELLTKINIPLAIVPHNC